MSGPVIADTLAVGFSVAQVSRDGFTVNDVTGNDIDSRSAFSAKGQLLFKPDVNWEARVIVTGERARDGDYGLNDVAALRANPFHAARDFEGFANRDIFGTTIHVRRTGGPLVFSSTTGIVKWTTQDVTDLDYTPQPLIQRDNTEEDLQFTQELRVASSEQSPIQLSDSARLRWQAGVFFFTQGYEQDAVNSFSPFLVAPFPVSQHSPRSALDDSGVGLFGQATVTFGERFDLSAGARFDHESKEATLETFYEPQIAPPSRVDAEKGFSSVSPQVSAAWRLQPEHTLYATVGRGFKAGGFNSASPAGSEAYDEEQTWNVEGGIKTLWAGGRVSANAAVFHIDWDDLQLNVPNPAVPAQFFISNVGGATSNGVEFELGARAAPGLDLFAAFGYTHARFGAGSVSGPISIDGNKLPNTPDYTFSVGAQYSRLIGTRRRWRPDRPRALRRVPVQRRQLARPGGLLAGAPARRLHGAPLAGRGLGAQRVQHRVHSAGVPLPELRALRVHGRDGCAAHGRRQRRRPFLTTGFAPCRTLRLLPHPTRVLATNATAS